MLSDQSILQQIDLQPDHITAVPAKLRNRILRFLLRWQAYEATLACLEVVNRPDLVSMQDLRAKALIGLDRAQTAVQVVEQRLQQSQSLPAQALYVAALLADGQTAAACRKAFRLSEERTDSGTAWRAVGDAHLAADDLDTAESAFLQYQKITPRSRTALWGLARVHQARGDLVTAGAYAVRAYATDDDEAGPYTDLLRELRDFFAETGDQNRLREADEQLAARYEQEVAEMREQLAEKRPSGLTPTAPAQRPSGPTPATRKPAPALPDLDAITVTAAERERIEAAVAHHFNFNTLRPAQLQIMACALRGEDVLAVLPTGAGKSLCYQLPALLDERLTLVISPLIALMKDQVDSLPADVRHRALALNSSLDGRQLDEAITDIAAGRYKLVYAAPERLRQPAFIHALNHHGVDRVVIDEAHCVSTWGHDFRPDYLWVGAAHDELGAPPVLAMTATAPPLVRGDIERRLFPPHENGDRSFRLIALDTFRPNLRLAAIAARDNDNKMIDLVNLCHRLPAPGIIYARTRRNCEEIAAILRRQGLSADHYHAGIHNRSIVQERFMRGQTDIIVATVAFGMGVDKADIRFIIHYGLPNSAEAYYQEAGRAGRDGDNAYCILISSRHDKGQLTRMANRDALDVETLRRIYAAVRRKIAVGETDTINLEQLASYLDLHHTMLRVGISTLERAGLLARSYDAPHTVMFNLRRDGSDLSPLPAALAEHLRLMPGQPVSRNFADVAAAVDDTADLPLSHLELKLLEWQSNGLMDVTTSGRDAIISLPDPPDDASDRIVSLLDQSDTVQQQRITEISSFARTRHCRHGYLANYLGGSPRPKCTQCDNCVGRKQILPAPNDSPAVLENEADVRWVLAALQESGWGHYSLLKLLIGHEDVSDRAQTSISYGAMHGRSERAIKLVITGLLRHGYLQEETLSHGGVSLQLAPSGESLLNKLGYPSAPPPPIPDAPSSGGYGRPW